MVTEIGRLILKIKAQKITVDHIERRVAEIHKKSRDAKDVLKKLQIEYQDAVHSLT
jgi:hypothetical protein